MPNEKTIICHHHQQFFIVHLIFYLSPETGSFIQYAVDNADINIHFGQS